jgi:hypothetical protein
MTLCEIRFPQGSCAKPVAARQTTLTHVLHGMDGTQLHGSRADWTRGHCHTEFAAHGARVLPAPPVGVVKTRGPQEIGCGRGCRDRGNVAQIASLLNHQITLDTRRGKDGRSAHGERLRNQEKGGCRHWQRRRLTEAIATAKTNHLLVVVVVGLLLLLYLVVMVVVVVVKFFLVRAYDES